MEVWLEPFAACWGDLDDPRSGNAGLHDFHEWLMIALCAMLYGGQGAVDMAWFREPVRLVFKAAETFDPQSGRAMGQLAQQPLDMARYDRLTAQWNHDEGLFPCNPTGTRCPYRFWRGPRRAGSPD